MPRSGSSTTPLRLLPGNGPAGQAQRRFRNVSTMDAQRRLSMPSRQVGAPTTVMVRPLLLKPQWMNGLSERLLVSHYENNYGGAVRRLNAIRTRLAALDWART